ncbi:CDP-alcohol phosphatidyltransferase family protein [Mariluticola halotolerans]|uniref:CDP-alcohol phosphatidyltransferase family protein n=1 Tax=Mariluticola halotolerans TaxID=2909283 RepID=UPI0026E2D4F8|nr:CDP-alcohol phosphatidyltransferase family protein [Mariluticola halotolerans]UJQ93044.1 CDP-alcohol phosphatidyltransferase family protein [Mariluticola halotolerans]
MLDGVMRKLIDPPLNNLGAALASVGMSANAMTLFGLGIGLAAAIAIAAQWFVLGLVLILVSRLADGLDGAIARATEKTDFGGYLDISADFLFYGAIPMGFVLANPESNAIAGAFLLFAFYFNGATFLGYAILAEKHALTTELRGIKSLYFTEGLLEGTETILFFVVLAIWPFLFPVLATIFALLCFVTGVSRWLMAYRQFGDKQTETQA